MSEPTIKLYYIGAATCLLDIDGQIKIGIDPALSPKGSQLSFKKFDAIRLKSPNYEKSILKDIDIWLITHSHSDHIDDLGKQMIAGTSQLICDKKTSQTIFQDRKTSTLSWGQSVNFSKEDYQLKITAIPAYHGNSFILRSLVGKVNGYLLEISKGELIKTIYFTGDTIFHEDVIKTLPKSIDIIIANLGNVQNNIVGGPLTMNLPMAKQFIEKLKPFLFLPIHIDDFSHYHMTSKEVRDFGIKTIENGKWFEI